MLDKVYVDRRVQRIQLNVISDHLVDSWQQEVINVSVVDTVILMLLKKL